MNKKTRVRCMNTLVCCMKQKNGKVKTKTGTKPFYPPSPPAGTLPVSGRESAGAVKR